MNNINKECKEFFGFTLSEVLITLAVIGMIAVVTIPILVKEYQKVQTLSKLKRVYSTVNQVLAQWVTDNGCTDARCSGIFEPFSASEFARRMGAIKACTSSDLSGSLTNNQLMSTYPACWGNKLYTDLNATAGGIINLTHTYPYQFLTKDGILYSVGSNNACSNWQFSCLSIDFNISGYKGPNVYGKDIFRINVYAKSPTYELQVVPSGSNKDSALSGYVNGQAAWNYYGANHCSQSDPSVSTECFGRIIEKGWIIDYY